MQKQENHMGTPDTHTNESTRLSNAAIDKRVAKCGELRYQVDNPISQNKWIEYCKEHYGDKSVPTYLTYWMKAKEEYEDKWKGKLEALLEPAQQQIQQLLHDDDPRVRSDAIKMIMKYSGNDIEKKLIRAEVQNISIDFGNE